MLIFFFGFLSPDKSPWVVLCRLIVSKPNLEVATKRLLDQQVKIPKCVPTAISGGVDTFEVFGCRSFRHLSSQ